MIQLIKCDTYTGDSSIQPFLDLYGGDADFFDDDATLEGSSLEGDDEMYTMFLEIMNNTQELQPQVYIF